LTPKKASNQNNSGVTRVILIFIIKKLPLFIRPTRAIKHKDFFGSDRFLSQQSAPKHLIEWVFRKMGAISVVSSIIYQWHFAIFYGRAKIVSYFGGVEFKLYERSI